MAENEKKLEKLNCLIELQSVITEKLSLESERETIPEDLHSDELALAKASQLLNSLEEDLRQAESEEKSLAIQYADADHQSSEYQKIVETLSTQREYEAMLKQITEAEGRAKSLLTARNAKNDQIKELNNKISAQTEVVNSLTDKVNAAKTIVEEKLRAIDSQIKELDENCNAIKGSVISEEYYNRFYNIAKKKGGEGLVPVRGQVCMGCNTVLPMEFVINLRLKQVNDEVDTCPYCSRMIYFDDSLSPEEEKNYIFDDIDTLKNITKGGDVSSDESSDESDEILVADDMDDEF